jgi:hypothetical protein
VQEIAHAIEGQAGAAPAAAGMPPPLRLEGRAGERVQDKFSLWNTSAGALRPVRLHATDLSGGGGAIPSKAIKFDPELVEHIRPGDGATVTVTVTIPKRTAEGTYRGLVQSEPGDACLILELNVLRGAAGKQAAAGTGAGDSTAQDAG